MSIFFRDVMLRTTGYAFKIFIDVLENILIHVPASIKADKDMVGMNGCINGCIRNGSAFPSFR